MGNIMYQHIKTIYDERADGRGQNTLEVVYNYKKMKYEVLCLTDSKLAQKKYQYYNTYCHDTERI